MDKSRHNKIKRCNWRPRGYANVSLNIHPRGDEELVTEMEVERPKRQEGNKQSDVLEAK